MDINLIVEGAFLEIKLSHEKNFKGLWKITNVEKRNDGEEDFYRMTLDKNTSVAGDEIFAEYYPSMADQLCILKPFDYFPLKDAQSWPPPVSIEFEDKEYNTMTPGAIDEDHPCFIGYNGDMAYQHWEYEDETSKYILQLVVEDKYVTMYSGCVLNTNFVELT